MGYQQLFPLTDSIWICFVVLMLVLFVPILCKKLRFPQIAGLIITGVLLGPGLLDILEITPEIKFFSRIGLLFIMFFAGLEIDLEEMKRNKVWGAIFGVLTFAVPWGLCFVASIYLLKLSIDTSAILACIMGSHTLISYPIISRYGLSRRKSVTISVAGALIAILLALVVYAVMMSTTSGEYFNPWWFILKITVYVAAVILLYPRMARRFFRNVTNSFSHFLFVMILLALSCGLAGYIGLDSIVGAFLAGIVLNRYIPKSSPLMNRLDFVGGTLFVPLFLIGTGLLIDLREMSDDWLFLIAFAVLFTIGTLGKWLVALFIQKTGKLQRYDRRIIFGLSESHAAGALAIAMGAFAGGLIDNSTLSTTVLIVLFSCILSNIITEYGALSIHQNEQSNVPARDNRTLVMLTGSNTLQAIMDTAITLYDRNDRDMVGLYVTINGDHAPKYLQDGKGRLEEAQQIAASADIPFLTHNRLGNNIVDSIIHASNEFETNGIIMGLPLRQSIDLPYFENIISPLNDGFHGQIVLQRFVSPINTIRRIVVLVPGPVLQDEAFEKCMESIYRISMAIGCGIEFYGKDQPISAVRGTGLNFSSGRVSYNEVSETADMHWVMSGLHSDHLLMIVGPRDNESHAGRSFRHLYERIHMPETDFSTMLLFPETQTIKGKQEATLRTERDFLKMLRM
ncbi:MAG: cation:proton antiporter [Bacteroidaceae bacterium]|nr:cation:proton antiporter [Bacteroidaceae bacterium]